MGRLWDLLRNRWRVRRNRPAGPLRRCLRRVQRGVAAIVALYAALLLFPQPLFPYSVRQHGITIYAAQPLPEEIRTVLDRADARLSTSELDRPDRRLSVFLCDRSRPFSFFSPVSRGAFGLTNIFGRIFIADADIRHDIARRAGPGQRSLSGVIAHEGTHRLIQGHCGRVGDFFMPTWKKEGYCEVIAGDASLEFAKGMEMLRAGRREDSGRFRYFLYRAMVRHLMDQGMTFREIVQGDFDPAVLEQQLVHAARNGSPERAK